MSETTKSASRTEVNNDLINKVLSSTETQTEPIEITAPADNLVNLPGGLIAPTGEVIRTAEVRELNGKDEEFIGKSNSVPKALATILSRATTRLGDSPADDGTLDSMLTGDRDALLLGIFKLTFGKTAELPGICQDCNEIKIVEIDVDRDVKTKILVNPIEDRQFTVQGRKDEFLVGLPTGHAQKELAASGDKNSAELVTILLTHCIVEINGFPVMNKSQVQNLGIIDRKKIADEIYARVSGPQFEDIELECDNCGGKVVVPISLGALFRF